MPDNARTCRLRSPRPRHPTKESTPRRLRWKRTRGEKPHGCARTTHVRAIRDNCAAFCTAHLKSKIRAASDKQGRKVRPAQGEPPPRSIRGERISAERCSGTSAGAGRSRALPKKMACDKICLSTRVANGPSWAQVAEYPLIHLLDLRRSGWQVHSASRQESAGKGQRGSKIRGRPGFSRPGIVFDSGFPTTFASTLELGLGQRDVRFQACAMDELTGGSLKRRPRRLYITSNTDRASRARPEGRSDSVRGSFTRGCRRLGDGARLRQSDRSRPHAYRSDGRAGSDARALC